VRFGDKSGGQPALPKPSGALAKQGVGGDPRFETDCEVRPRSAIELTSEGVAHGFVAQIRGERAWFRREATGSEPRFSERLAGA